MFRDRAVPRRPQRAWPRGQSLVEFAITLPILLLLLVAAIDLGRLFSVYIGTQNAAREGAGWASRSTVNAACWTPAQCPNPGNIQYRARQELSGDTGLTVTVSCVSACGTPVTTVTGNTVRVSVSKPFTPLVTTFFGASIGVGASARAVIQ